MANNETENGAQLIIDAAQKVADSHESDVILLNHPIGEDTAADFHLQLEGIASQKKTVFLILVTLGGDAHAAYVIARDLQLRYDKVTICIAGDCYSAGTLIVLSANEVVISDRGRLGPLDVQILKKDEIGERVSGLTVDAALKELRDKALDSFCHFAYHIRARMPILSFRTAMEMSSQMTGALYGEIFKQIDPLRLAADAMALQIAGHYGAILATESKNLRAGAIKRLLKDYPSHNCIIDRQEAERELFNHVRVPSPAEEELLKLLKTDATDAADLGEGFIYVLSGQTSQDSEHGEAEHENKQQQHLKTNGKSAKGTGTVSKPSFPGASKNGAGAPAEASSGAQ